MTRLIIRTVVQLLAVTVVSFFIIFFLDRYYRVLPPSIHEYMPLHIHGLVVTDITILSCSSRNPFSDCEVHDPSWQSIEKDLFLGRVWNTHAWVHVRRKPEADLKSEDTVVIDVAVGALRPDFIESTSSGPNTKQQLWEQRPMGLWVLRTLRQSAGDSRSAVTSVDVLFGDDVVEIRPGWYPITTPLMLGSSNTALLSPRLTIRRGASREVKKPKLRIPDNGRFKILQVSDLHLSTGVGVCRDLPKGDGGPCQADLRTLEFLVRLLDEERPDLVVLSGDQVHGESAPDAQSAIFKYAFPLIERKIPYVTIFGNHDDRPSHLSRIQQMAIVEALPYSLSQSGPTELSGVGNYFVEVFARGSSDHAAITIYLLDSHSYSPDERHYPGYDWIKDDQIDWFRSTASRLKQKHREYTLVHMDLAFIHIPLPEYREPYQAMVGQYREIVTAPFFNTNFRDALVDQGVVMVSCGHDHVNDYCALSVDEENNPVLWMCYAGGSGLGGYGGYGGFTRRMRVFDVDTNAARITTWKRRESGDIVSRVDEQIIVEDGKPVAPPPPPE